MSSVRQNPLRVAVALALFAGAAPLAAATQPPPAPTYLYADLADLSVAAPMVIDGVIRSSARIKPADATGLAPGMARYYVTIDVVALIRARDAAPAQIGYVFDLPTNSPAMPRRKQRVVVFARPVATMPGQVQLISDKAQLAWSPATEATVRDLARDVTAAKAPPMITGIGNAFHSPGSLPGEGETQVFLTTGGGPVSLSVTRRQGVAPSWTVALSEVVDDALPPPRRDTFLWYRLACGLPPSVPDGLLAPLDPADSAAVRDDYALVKRDLGPCRPSNGPIAG